jgi:hypothetical protein
VNHRADPSLLAVDVSFTEDVDPAFAGDPLSYTASGGQTVQDVLILAPDVVRLTLSAQLGLGHTVGTTSLPDAAGITSGAISIAPVL